LQDETKEEYIMANNGGANRSRAKYRILKIIIQNNHLSQLTIEFGSFRCNIPIRESLPVPKVNNTMNSNKYKSEVSNS
jgi:hypothetical protein